MLDSLSPFFIETPLTYFLGFLGFDLVDPRSTSEIFRFNGIEIIFLGSFIKGIESPAAKLVAT